MPTNFESAAVAGLDDATTGSVLLPDSDGYAAETVGYNLAYPHTPDIVVGAETSDDIAAAVRFAVAHDLPVRVFATGHGAHSTVSGGVLINTSRLASVDIDPVSRTATIGAGGVWSDVQAAAAPHGLAGISGSAASVGVVGYLLGGGLGPLARSHGISSDYVRSFDVVTATGEIVVASASENPDLFWALRGGKGGLGVVTSVVIDLVELPGVYGGALWFETDDIDPGLRGWLDYTATAPDSVTTSALIVSFPPLDFIPEPMRGRTLLSLRFAHPGSEDEGVTLAAPLRALATPMMDTLGMLAADQLHLIHSDPEDAAPSWSDGLLLGRLDDSFVDTLLAAAGPSSGAPVLGVELRHIGAATTRDVDEGSAIGGRDAQHTLMVLGAPDPALFDTVLPGYMAGLRAAIAPWTSAETSINFVGNPHDVAEFSRAWSEESRERLASVRQQWDPTGVFAYGPQ